MIASSSPTKPVRISTAGAVAKIAHESAEGTTKIKIEQVAPAAAAAAAATTTAAAERDKNSSAPTGEVPYKKQNVMSPPDVVPRAHVASRRRGRGGSAARAGHWRRRCRGHTTRDGAPRDQMGGL